MHFLLLFPKAVWDKEDIDTTG